MRIRYAILALLLVGSAAYAETDYIALQKIEAIKKGANTPDQIQDLRVQDDATIGDDLAVGGDVTVTGNATVTGTLTASGAMRLPVLKTVEVTAVAYTCTVANVAGSLVLCNTNAAMAIVLPANAAAVGTWFDLAVIGSDDCVPTVSAATADTLITPNSVDSDSVTWGSGHRINAYARFWSDGAKWHVQNLGGTTMTVTDTD